MEGRANVSKALKGPLSLKQRCLKMINQCYGLTTSLSEAKCCLSSSNTSNKTASESALSIVVNSGKLHWWHPDIFNVFIRTTSEKESLLTGKSQICKCRQSLLKFCGRRCQRNDWFDQTAAML